MSTTAKIDFEPGLFDEGQTEAAPDLPGGVSENGI